MKDVIRVATGGMGRTAIGSAALALLLGVAACSGPTGGVGTLAVSANAYLLPEFTSGVTTLGDFSTRALFQQASPKVGLVVMWVEAGTLRVMPLAQFKTTYANWALWVVKSYTPGFASPPMYPLGSDHHKWIGATMANKGGDVGVIIDMPPVPATIEPHR